MHLLIGPFGWLIAQLFSTPNGLDWARAALEVVSFSIKVGFFLWFVVWIRWTLPRFRYDQLMNFGWKFMLPLALFNIALTAVLIYIKVI
jgi:NADH-quinone oxidoreductase subunit H